MKKLIYFMMFSWIAMSASLASQIPTQLIVKFKESKVDTTETNLNVLSRRIGVEIIYERTLFNESELITLDGSFKREEIERMISVIAADDSVDYVHENRRMYHTATANDELYPSQWNLKSSAYGITVEHAWDYSLGEGVVVAVIDSGYTPHVDLVDNIIGGYDMISDLNTSNDGDGRDSDASDPGDWTVDDECGPGSQGSSSSWHGTHVAGIISAVTNNNIGIAGTAPDAKIVPIRVLGKCGGVSTDTADAIVWAAGGEIDGVPNNPNPAQVINMSLGGEGACDQLTQDAINEARDLGAVVVVAAGNNNSLTANYSPASCYKTITVAATNAFADKASYSNYGIEVELTAPGGEFLGERILSTSNSGATVPESDIYIEKNGTSQAAPQVSGVVAMMLALNPTLSGLEVVNILRDTTRPFPLNSTCPNAIVPEEVCGRGMLDAYRALRAVDRISMIPPVAKIKIQCPSSKYLTCGFYSDGSYDEDGFIQSYQWRIGGAIVSEDSTFFNQFNSPGNYVIELEVTDNRGLKHTASEIVVL